MNFSLTQEFQKAHEHTPSPEEVETARERLVTAAEQMFQKTEMVDTTLSTAAAKIIGATQPKSDNYLFAESMIFAGRP